MSSKLLDVWNKSRSENKRIKTKFAIVISKILSKIDNMFFSKQEYREGSWYGNDTIWRTVIDINKIIKYADKNGKLCCEEQRKIFNIADMVIIGEKEGPLLPSPRYGGIIAMGEDIVCFDEIIATIMGFNVNKIPLLKHIRNIKNYPIVKKDVYGKIISNNTKWNNKNIKQITKDITLNIEPSSGWKGHIEL